MKLSYTYLNSKQLYLGLFLSFFNAIVSLGLFLVDVDVDSHLVRIIGILSYLIFLILLYLKRDNILYFARTLFLGFIGYYPIMIKALLGVDTYFSSYEYSTQGLDIVIIMYVGTSLALLGNELGLILGNNYVNSPAKYNKYSEKNIWKISFWISVVLVVASSLLVSYSNGPLIFYSGYAGSENKLPLGSVSVIGVFGVLLSFAATYKVRIQYGKLIVGLLFILLTFWAMLLRGDRNDALSCMLGLIVTYGLVMGRPFRLKFKAIAIIFPLVILLFIYGAVRSKNFSTLNTNQLVKSFSSDHCSSKVIKFGTVSPIATTYANVVWAIENGLLDMAYGLSYAEFVLRIPPEFLYPDRPRDYAWIFSDLNFRAGGGFFELAEAYMNFGLIGCFIFPMLLSFIISRFFSNVLNRQRFIDYILLFGFLCVFFRGTWYQTFAFFRGFTLSIVLYISFNLIYQLIYIPTKFSKLNAYVQK